jgi:ribosomal protein S27E
LVERHYSEFKEALSQQGKQLPKFIEREFDDFLRCGRLEYGFLRVVCGDCKHEKLVAFSCKRRGFCPSCGARRMAESAALLVDDVLQGYPIRQWVLSLPIPLRLLLARYPNELSKVMGIIHRAISTHIVNRAGFTTKQARAMSWAQRLKRVFNIDITECEKCQQYNVSIIACIIDVHVIQKILANLEKKYPTSKQVPLLPPLRATPDEQYANDFNIQRDFNFGA